MRCGQFGARATIREIRPDSSHASLFTSSTFTSITLTHKLAVVYDTYLRLHRLFELYGVFRDILIVKTRIIKVRSFHCKHRIFQLTVFQGDGRSEESTKAGEYPGRGKYPLQLKNKTFYHCRPINIQSGTIFCQRQKLRWQLQIFFISLRLSKQM